MRKYVVLIELKLIYRTNKDGWDGLMEIDVVWWGERGVMWWNLELLSQIGLIFADYETNFVYLWGSWAGFLWFWRQWMNRLHPYYKLQIRFL